MIVDIGGGTTEVAVISLGGIVFAESLRVGGDELDQAIVRFVRSTHNVLIGDNTAERVKFEIGSALPVEGNPEMTIRGRDLGSGMPREVVLTNEEIVEALREPVARIVAVTRTVLEHTEPELAADLLERGMCLAGGGALLRGLPELLAHETGLPVQVAEDPLDLRRSWLCWHLRRCRQLRDLFDDEDN